MQDAKEINVVPVRDFVTDNYLPFAWSVCLERALVYSQDGLKPIQRRILYTAYKNGISDTSAKVKSATFEGKVMEFSPHGGSYGVIVNMAAPEDPGQPRDIRVPLIRGKGNWGGISGGAASSRYTTMNLFPAANEILKELNENAVDMVPNYDSSTVEPLYLPARFPVALINGVPSAMAVGFACNLPSHNPDEVMDAAIALLKNPKISIDKLAEYIKGPDFDCGCDIIPYTMRNGEWVDGIDSYLKTGSGSFVMRAVHSVKEDKGSYIINFTKLPYKISPEKVCEEIRNKYENGEFKELVSWKDLSDINEPVNLEIVTKKNVSLPKVMNDLYKMTSLRCVFAANDTILIDNIPVKADVKTIISEFIKFRKQCTERKLNYRMDKKKDKLHAQEAIASVLLDIDATVKIVRESDDEVTAQTKLMKKFKIDEQQAKYVLSLPLRSLTKKDIHKVNETVAALTSEVKEIEDILNDEKKFINFIASEMRDTKKNISSARKCKIINEIEDDEPEEQEVYLSLSDGKIARTWQKDFNGKPTYKTDNGKFMVVCENGNAVPRSLFELTEGRNYAYSRLKLPNVKTVFGSEGYLLVVGEGGSMKLTDLTDFKVPRKQIDSIFKQKIVSAVVIRERNGNVSLNNGETVVKLSDIPVQGIYAQNGKRFTNKQIVDVEVVVER